MKLTHEPKLQAIQGTAFAYVKGVGFGKLKCAGMIRNDTRAFYVAYFAGEFPEKPTCPQGVQTGPEAVLIFVPEYVGDLVAESDLLEIGECVYRGGKLQPN